MAVQPQTGLTTAAKRIARGALNVVSPALLRKVQLARAQRRYSRPPARGPRRVELEVTTGCNYRCLMCTDHSSLREENTPARHMPWERAEQLLRDTAAMGAEQVWLAGRGEPLVYPHIAQAVELAASLGLKTMITTNGGLLTEALADRLCDAGLSVLSVSINSASPECYALVHGARAEERARILGLMKRIASRAKKPHLSTSMVLLKPNYTEQLDFVRDAIAVGANAVDILGLRCGGLFPTLELNGEDWAQVRRDLAEANALANEAGVWFRAYCIPPEPGQRGAKAPDPAAPSRDWSPWTLGCFVGYQFVRVDVDGDLHGCCSCSNHLGSLNEGSFAEAWRSPSYERFRWICRHMPVTKFTPPLCNCTDCGNVMDNEEAYLELQFHPVPGRAEERLATRLDVAQVVWDQLGGRLPKNGEAPGYADITPEQAGPAWAAITGLQAAGVMVGVPRSDGKRALLPRQVATFKEAATVLQRSLALLGLDSQQAEQVVTHTAPQLNGPAPMLIAELEAWARAVRAEVAQAPRSG